MIVTHTQNARGDRRIYLGGKSSLECWIEPGADNRKWTFHVETSPGAYPLPTDQQRAWAVHILNALSDRLHVPPNELHEAPFDSIAALHDQTPGEFKRAPTPKRQKFETAFVTSAPDVRSPVIDRGATGHRRR